MSKQIVVIGGGAAGMLAAISAAERGAAVTLLEPNERLGKKLNITGKGRCNLTNDADTETVLTHVPGHGRFLYSALSRFGPRDVMAFFEDLGVPLKVERGNRVFPVSDRSFDVSGALERRLRKLGVQWVRDRAVSIETDNASDSDAVRLNAVCPSASTVCPSASTVCADAARPSASTVCPSASAVCADAARPSASAVRPTVGADRPAVKAVRGERDTYPADAVILATGGVSYPATGSTGEGHRMARELGHTVTPLRGSLVPLCEAGNVCARMQGLSLRNVRLTVWEGKVGKRSPADGGKAADLTDGGKAADLTGIESALEGRDRPSKEKRIYQGFGELLFTHFGVSGPLVLSASAHMRRFDDRAYRLEIDLKPALDETTLDHRLLSDLQKYANHNFANSLGGLLPRKMIPVMVDLSGIPSEKKSGDVTREERRRLLGLLKRFPVPVAGPRPVTEAIVTSGGVSVKEVDPSSMASKRVKGLYFAGEILDVDAYTGGFNLQIAWCTGRAAGFAAAE